jgi:hypothetical protein
MCVSVSAAVSVAMSPESAARNVFDFVAVSRPTLPLSIQQQQNHQRRNPTGRIHRYRQVVEKGNKITETRISARTTERKASKQQRRRERIVTEDEMGGRVGEQRRALSSLAAGRRPRRASSVSSPRRRLSARDGPEEAAGSEVSRSTPARRDSQRGREAIVRRAARSEAAGGKGSREAANEQRAGVQPERETDRRRPKREQGRGELKTDPTGRIRPAAPRHTPVATGQGSGRAAEQSQARTDEQEERIRKEVGQRGRSPLPCGDRGLQGHRARQGKGEETRENRQARQRLSLPRPTELGRSSRAGLGRAGG